MIIFYKQLGETPLQALDRLRIEQPEYQNVSLTYAGRLDPMAEGLLLVLAGDECNDATREKYLGLDKEYEVEMLFGLETDTHDILGLITSSSKIQPNENLVVAEIKKLPGKQLQQYPAYSSKPVAGKSLFQWAREGKLDEIERPTREIEIFGVKIKSFKNISGAELLAYVRGSVSEVTGDFRQKESLELWNEKVKPDDIFVVYKLVISCSSGTYIRQLANVLGQKLACGALVLTLKRTRVGQYDLDEIQV